MKSPATSSDIFITDYLVVTNGPSGTDGPGAPNALALATPPSAPLNILPLPFLMKIYLFL